MATAVLFPGQGSLTAESGDHARAALPELVERACEMLGGDPFARAAESTAFAQPATFLASLAGWAEQDLGREPAAIAGHSLGEFAALVAAGALDPFDGLWLVALRGRLMAEAAAGGAPGGMTAVLGGAPEEIARLAELHRVTIANDNAPGQVVVSGELTALTRFAADARATGLKTISLDVTGAFHSPAVAAAEQPFRRALEDTPWGLPRVPVVSGCTARVFRDMPLELACALVRPVRWREVMARLVELGADEFVDVGPGRVLARLAKRNVARPEDRVLAR